MNRPTPLPHAHNRPSPALSTMMPATTSSSNSTHKVNSSMTMTILDRIAAERQKIQEEDNKRHQQYRREATSISCKHRISSCYDEDVSPPVCGLVPTLTKTYTRIANNSPPNYDGITIANKSSRNMQLVQISSAASQQRRNSASNANERHFLVDNSVGNDEDDDGSPPPSTNTNPNLTPPKRRPHPNSLLSTTWNMASSQSIHDEMERIRLLMADMDSHSSRSQQRKPRRSSAFVSSSTAPPASPTKLASRKTR